MDIIDVSGVAPDLATVEALARSQLALQEVMQRHKSKGAPDCHTQHKAAQRA